jgi:shikimate dehydrogenase
MKLGLLGYPLSHSFSKAWFEEKFKQVNISGSYSLFESPHLEEFITQIIPVEKPDGFNVTIPYKQHILPFLDSLSPEAAISGAVNCVKVDYHKSGRHAFFLKGFNTDITGFRKSLAPFLEPHHNRALILGNGGASKAVQFVLKELNIPFTIVTRAPSSGHRIIPYENLTEAILQMNKLIINCTPLGMFPNVQDMPLIPYQGITQEHFCIDLIYNPAETLFLKESKLNGAMVLNGMDMLKHQAEEAFKIWSNPVL